MNIQTTTTAVVFNGTGREYFGIWIVNLLLSLVTLGVYSAWAKVRRKKYFYNNTQIDHVGFDYHANPISILKGRAIAFTFFLLYVMGDYIHMAVPLTLIIIFFIALPWLVVRASMFNARNSSHRGLRFDFDGKVGEAFKAYFLLPLLTVISLGVAAPYVVRQQHKFLIDQHKYGASHFDMQATSGQFYSIYLKFFGIFLLISVISTAVIFGLSKSMSPLALAPAPVIAKFTDNTQQPDNPSQETLYPKTAQDQNINDSNEIQSPSTITGDNSAAANSTDTAEQDKATTNAKIQKILTNPWIIIGFLIPYLLFILGIVSYFQARIGNLVWNSTTLDKISFISTLRFRDLLWIYISNFLAIMLTFGLATPWAQIRSIKYRTGKLAIVSTADLDAFAGDKKAEAKAFGEEIADMFDIDISFG